MNNHTDEAPDVRERHTSLDAGVPVLTRTNRSQIETNVADGEVWLRGEHAVSIRFGAHTAYLPKALILDLAAQYESES